MNKYEILLNSLLNKYKNYCIELQNYTQSKATIEGNLNITETEIKDKKLELQRFEDDFNELVYKNKEYKKKTKEYKILRWVGVFLGAITSVAALAVMSNYTDSFTIKALSMLGTFIVTSGISITSDTINYQKETKELKEFIDNHDACEMKDNIRELAISLDRLEDIQETRKNKIETKEENIATLQIKITTLQEYINKISTIINEYKNGRCLHKDAINEHYQNDPIVEQAQALIRKKKKGEKHE